MDDDADRDYFKAVEVHATLRARQIKLDSNGKIFWIPLSVSDWHRDGVLMVETWFAHKEGML